MRRAFCVSAALAVACLSLLVLAAGRGDVAKAATPNDASACPPETATCSQQSFPGTDYTVTAGPVNNVGLNQAVYVSVAGVPTGDELEIAYCSLAAGPQVVAEPQCASAVPVAGEVPTPATEQYEYGTVTTNDTVLAIPTEYDPDIPGADAIVSQTSQQLFAPSPPTDVSGSFFCDNASNPCAVEVMLFTQTPNEVQYVTQDGLPPQQAYSAVGQTVIFPLTFNQGGNGCGSAPVLEVDASYSAAQFIPAAGQATCTGSNGVAAVPTELPSTDSTGCSNGGGSGCPIYDVIDGNAPASFTDDPEDPATLAELKAAGGKFAYIPIAVSATEIAFSGSAGSSFGGSSTVYPLDSYELTPAMAAGIMTQQWDAATASPGYPNDDLCAQLSGKGQCSENPQTSSQTLMVEATTKGDTGNLAVSQAVSTTSKNVPFDIVNYGPPDNFYDGGGEALGGSSGCTGTCAEKLYYGDTGFALLNPWPFSSGGIPTSEEQLGAMWPSTASGATFQTTSWMCQAPTVNYTGDLPYGGTASLHDMLSGQQILADAELDPVAAQNNTNGLTPGVVDQHIVYSAKKCQALSALPIDFAGSTATVNATYEPSSSPLTASHAVLAAVAKYGGTGGFGFTAMDSSEADFFGLLPASLQNAAGAFVGPSAQSVTAAINDATKNPDGTLSPNLDDTNDAAAYPLPMVTYALVATSDQPTADGASQLKDLLTNLVTYSHNGGSAAEPLPSGYYPLPSSLYDQAMSDIASDIVGPGGSTPGTSSNSGSGSSAGTSPGSGGASGGARGSSPGASGGSAGSRGGAGGGVGAHGSAAATTPSSGSAGGSSPANFVGRLITVTLGDNRYFVPALLLLALLCLLAGPLLYFSPALRKSAGIATGDDGEGGAQDGGDRGPPGDA